jgi:8-oxo-dGTP pyrophosphatase MutT (NUDIX family)
MARDFEKWGEVKNIGADVLMTQTFKAIDESDIVIIEFSEKGVGLGIEAGYAFSKVKPIIVIAKEGSEVSATLQGIANRVFFYKDIKDLNQKFKDLIVKRKGVAFLIVRPDKKTLLQLRDGNSRKYKNLWCFPGGVCEEGEEYLDTVVREAKEEYELDIDKKDCTLLMTRIADNQHVFACRVDGKQEPVLHEGADMKWMSIDEIKNLAIGYNQGNIIPKLEEYLNKI